MYEHNFRKAVRIAEKLPSKPRGLYIGLLDRRHGAVNLYVLGEGFALVLPDWSEPKRLQTVIPWPVVEEFAALPDGTEVSVEVKGREAIVAAGDHVVRFEVERPELALMEFSRFVAFADFDIRECRVSGRRLALHIGPVEDGFYTVRADSEVAPAVKFCGGVGDIVLDFAELQAVCEALGGGYTCLSLTDRDTVHVHVPGAEAFAIFCNGQETEPCYFWLDEIPEHLEGAVVDVIDVNKLSYIVGLENVEPESLRPLRPFSGIIVRRNNTASLIVCGRPAFSAVLEEELVNETSPDVNRLLLAGASVLYDNVSPYVYNIFQDYPVPDLVRVLEEQGAIYYEY